MNCLVTGLLKVNVIKEGAIIQSECVAGVYVVQSTLFVCHHTGSCLQIALVHRWCHKLILCCKILSPWHVGPQSAPRWAFGLKLCCCHGYWDLLSCSTLAHICIKTQVFLSLNIQCGSLYIWACECNGGEKALWGKEEESQRQNVIA